MKIVVNLDPATYERIKSLVNDGEYESVEQFLRVGADNQLAIEAGEDASDEPSSADEPSESTSAPVTDMPESVTTYEWADSVPADVPTRDPYPADRGTTLLFSQYYRFLPLKFVLRELAIETADADGPVGLDRFRDHVADAVIPLRDALVDWEAAEDVSKQNRLSTGFPNRGSSDPQRTMRRYLHHYVGRYKPEKEEPSGFGHDLGFVSIRSDANGDPRICLTEAGMQFTRLSNPVLSQGPGADVESLTDDERAFLVTHIRSILGLEYEFMHYVYETLEHHRGTYTDTMEQFRSFLVNTDQFSDDPSENQIRSHTAGTISRMVVLGVLERGRRRGSYNTVRPLESYRYDDTNGEVYNESHDTGVHDE